MVKMTKQTIGDRIRHEAHRNSDRPNKNNSNKYAYNDFQHGVKYTNARAYAYMYENI